MGRGYRRSIKNNKNMINNKNIETIKKGEEIFAVIIYENYYSEGTKFFTPSDFPQQLAFISRKAGEFIGAHTHNIIDREIKFTHEVLVIKKGKIKVNFYDSERNFFDSRVLNSGDIILLAGGGHGFEFLEDTEMVEVKQGPYLAGKDKTNFKGIEEKKHDSSK